MSTITTTRAKQAAAARPKFDLGVTITDTLIAYMEKGLDWRAPYVNGGLPCSMSTGKPYTGINPLLLAFSAMDKGYGSTWWGTHDQVQERCGMVKVTSKYKNGKPKTDWVHPDGDYDANGTLVTARGIKPKVVDAVTGDVISQERSTMVVFFKRLDKGVNDATGAPVIKPNGKPEMTSHGFYRYYNVFNAEQADWPDGMPKRFLPVERGEEFEPLAEAEAIVAGYLSNGGPTVIRKRQDVAYYQPSTDTVNVPAAANMRSSHDYYSTLFHELGHSTGHASRLKREGITGLVAGHKRGETYSFEELVAEFTAGILCGHSGIHDTLENSAAYLAHWAKFLRSDTSAVIKAAAKAQRAVNLIMGVTYEDAAPES